MRVTEARLTWATTKSVVLRIAVGMEYKICKYLAQARSLEQGLTDGGGGALMGLKSWELNVKIKWLSVAYKGMVFN